MFIVVSHYLYKVIHAERRGFEPRIPFRGIHAFQACLFNHSSISPRISFCEKGGKSGAFRANPPLFQLQMYSFFWSYEYFEGFNLTECPEINKL